MALMAGAGAVALDTPAAVTGNTRVDKLLSQLTLEEKISLIHGTVEDPAVYQGQAGYLPGIKRLGIPSLRMADGPPGVLTRVPSTAPTATMGVAATWSRHDAEENGKVIAREAISHGIDVVLQPFINIDRDITFERGYNTFGEDPVLTGQMAAAEITGIQGLGIMSQAKHYVGYDTNGTDVFIDQQALREIYVAPFVDASAVGVSSVMCSYNKINGKYACGNSDTLEKILKGEVGFKGFVTSDWGANHKEDFINAGLDMEMPGKMAGEWAETFMHSYFDNARPGPDRKTAPPPAGENTVIGGMPEEPHERRRGGGFPMPPPERQKNMRDALAEGKVNEATITQAVGRVLQQMDHFGLLDGKSRHEITPSAVEENAKAIERTGEDAAVLLKNEGGALPLTKASLGSVVFIGPGAGQTIAIGAEGEKAVGLPERQIGAVEVLRKFTHGDPAVRISYAVADDMTGKPIPAAMLSHDGKPGLERTGGSAGQVDAQLDFTKGNDGALPNTAPYTWRGTLTAPTAGDYRLYLQMLGAWASLSVDGKKVTDVGRKDIHGDITQAGQDNVLPTTDGLDNARVELKLAAGPHALEVTAKPDTSNNPIQIRLNWVTPEQRRADYAAAVAAARTAKTAVVFAWTRGTPDFALPGDQNALIADVAKVNKNTIVVLNVSQPVAMPWLGSVKAVLQMWWPGDEGGWAATNLLMGRVSPAGRLPFTWPKRLEDMAANDPAHPERSAKGVDGKTTDSEGIFVGYRWFDAQKIEPLYPFGYGLSYTKFEYANLKTAPASDGGLDVSFEVKNTGPVAGDEVPQVYLGPPVDVPQGAQFAVRALAGFERIHLNAGDTRTVSIHLPLRRLQYWSTAEDKWMTAAKRSVYAGASSRDLRLNADVGQ
jgi:beta-glucosidase